MLLNKIETLFFVRLLNILTKNLADKIGGCVVVDCRDFILPRLNHQQQLPKSRYPALGLLFLSV
jgi:hypothetical protein